MIYRSKVLRLGVLLGTSPDVSCSPPGVTGVVDDVSDCGVVVAAVGKVLFCTLEAKSIGFPSNFFACVFAASVLAFVSSFVCCVWVESASSLVSGLELDYELDELEEDELSGVSFCFI